MTTAKVNELARRLARAEMQLVSMSSASQLPHSSIDNGAIGVYEDGNLRARVGLQHDGTWGAFPLDGPTPPTPSAPSASGGPGTMNVFWDGLWSSEEYRAPLDLHGVEVYVCERPFESTSEPDVQLVGFIPDGAGGVVSIAWVPGVWHVGLVAKAATGKLSELSSLTTVEVEQFVDDSFVTELEDRLALAEAQLGEVAEELSSTGEELDRKLSDLNSRAGSLIPNGGFERGTDEWTIDGASQVIESTDPVRPGHVLSVPPSETDQWAYSAWVPASSTRGFMVGFAARRVAGPEGSNNTTVRVQLEVQNADGSVVEAASSGSSGGGWPIGQWRNLGTSAVLTEFPDAARVRVAVYVRGQASSYEIDDVYLLEATAGMAAMQATNAAVGNLSTQIAERPRVVYSADPAPAPNSGSFYPQGSLWFQTDESGSVIGLWQQDHDGGLLGRQWTPRPVTSEVIANLDVGKLRAGSAELHEAVIGKLWTEVVRAKLLAADEALIGGTLIKEGAITAPKITASEELWAKVLGAHKISAAEIDVLDLAANSAFIGELDSAIVRSTMFEGKSFIGGTFTGTVFRTAASGARIEMSSLGIRGWNSGGTEVLRINGVDNLITGQLQTNAPGSPGIILLPRTSTSQPGIWFSSNGGTSGSQPAIFADTEWKLNIRGRSDTAGSYGPVNVIGGLEITVGGIVHRNGTWMIDNSGIGSFTSVETSGGWFRLYNTDFRYFNPPTSTFAANVGIATNPQDRIYKLTSARRYKLVIEDFPEDKAERLLSIHPRTWFDKHATEAYAAHLDGDGPKLEDIPNLRRIPGLVAEEVEEAGLEEYVTYNDTTGEVDGLMYDRLWTLLIPLVREQRDTIAALEERLAALEARIN